MTDAILAVLILLPVIVTYFLKSNGALGFLAICAGYTLESLAGGDIDSILHNANLKSFTNADLALIIFIASLFLTLFFSSRSWAGQSKMIINVIAAAASGILLAVVAIPYLASVVNLNLYGSKIWPEIQHIRGSLVIAGTIYALLVVWFSRTKHPSGKHKN
jgi:hypothetical protein